MTSIGDYAFENNQLPSVDIPDSVTSIGDYAFKNNSITSVTYGTGLTYVGVDTFKNNPLPSITLPKSTLLQLLGGATTVTVSGDPFLPDASCSELQSTYITDGCQCV